MQATYAVTVETLKHLPTLQPLLERTQLVETSGGVGRSLGLVLAYELLFGEGLRPAGPAERAVLQRKVSCCCSWLLPLGSACKQASRGRAAMLRLYLSAAPVLLPPSAGRFRAGPGGAAVRGGRDVGGRAAAAPGA